MNATNDFLRCAVKIEHFIEDAQKLVKDVQLITSINVQRRIRGVGPWQEIRNITIITSDDLNFVMLDYSAISHRVYEYRTIAIADSDYIGSIVSVQTHFDGILIATPKKCFISVLSPEYTHQRDYNVAYIRPFNSKYPHAIHNGLANSSRGTIKGYFNPIGPDCTVEMKYGDYADELLDFLSNGEPKILKTFDGHAWYVEIDSPIKRSYNNIVGLVEISFSWTEIGEVLPDISQLF